MENENNKKESTIITQPKCFLSENNTDFELLVSPNRLSVKTRKDYGFEWLWKSVKSNYGVHGGKYMFECKILNNVEIDEWQGEDKLAKQEFTEKTLDTLNQRHQVRIGWSTFSAKSNLGMDFEGVGLDNNGVKHYGGIQRNFTISFTVGDVIRCCIDLQETYTVSYFKNGVSLGPAYKIPERFQYKSFFPHICLRNIEVEMNFGAFGEFCPIVQEERREESQEKMEDENIPSATEVKEEEPLSEVPPNEHTLPKIENETENENPQSMEDKQVSEQEHANDENQDQISSVEKDSLMPTLEETKIESKKEEEILNVNVNKTNEILQSDLNDNLLEIKKYEINISEYKFLEFAYENDIEYEGLSSVTCEQRTLIMMIGLPCSGKTTYSINYMQKNYEKNFIILSSFEIFDHIINTLMIPKLKSNIILLMEICNEIFNKSLLLASKTNKNFIIDQTNVLFHSRMEKLELFSDFFKEAIVIVLSESEQKKRVLKKERLLSKNNFLYPKLCKESYRNLQENFSLPDGEGFDKITYPELDEETSHKVVCLLNKISENEVHPLLREKNFNELKDQKISAASLKEAVKFDTETPITTQDVRAIMNQQHAFVSKKPERTSSVVSQPSIIYKSAQKTVYQAPPKPSPSYQRKAPPSYPKPSYAPYKPVLSRAMPGLSSQSKPMHGVPPPPPPPPQPKYSPRQANQASPVMSKPYISKPPIKNNVITASPSLSSKSNQNSTPSAPVLRNYNSSLVRTGAGVGAGVGAGAGVGYSYGYGQQSGVSSGYGQQSGNATNNLSGVYGQGGATATGVQNVGERGQGYYGMGGSGGIYGSSAGMYGVSNAASQGSSLSNVNNNSYLQGQNNSAASYASAYPNDYGYGANYSQANLSANNSATANYYSSQAQTPKATNIQPAYQGYYNNQNYAASSNYQQQPTSNTGYSQQQTVVNPNDFNYYYNQSYNNLMYSQAANSGAKIPNSAGTIINNSENNFWKNLTMNKGDKNDMNRAPGYY